MSGNYFRVLQLPIASGRALTDADEDRPTVAVVSHGVWQEHFGGGPAVGATVRLNDVAFTIVGVAGPGAADTRADPVPRVWVPLSAQALLAPTNDHEAVSRVAGRLVPGATADTARAELEALNARFPPVQVREALVTTSLHVTGTELYGQNRAQRGVTNFSLMAVVPVLVLLLGCANIGNLQLARGFSRRREILTRLALGASRGRVIRQLLVEGLVLCAVAGGVSVLIAYRLPSVILLWAEPGAALATFDLSPNVAVFGFAGVLTCLTCLLAGLAPAVRVTRIGPAAQYVGVQRTGLRSSLLALQTAASVLLLLGSGLLGRGVFHAAGAGLGFDPYGVSVVTIDLPDEAYSDDRRRQFGSALLNALDTAGIRPAGAASHVPYSSFYTADVRLAGGATPAERPVRRWVSPGYFEVLGIALRTGRLFDDDAGEAVINETMARRFWPQADPLGQSFFVDGTETRVVGVVADARTEDPARSRPGFYEPVGAFRNLIVRADPVVMAQVRSLVSALEPRATVGSASLVAEVWERLRPAVVMTTAVTWIAVIALVLATVGTFGVFSHVVVERTREIGVRMALGARARDIASSLTLRLGQPLAAGLLLGLVAAQPLSFLVQHQLYGISVRDPLTYATVIIVLGLSACAALVRPIRRAVKIDPAAILRHE